MNELTHLDLFTGLAAWTIASRAEGIRTVAFVEKDKHCQDFLRKAWPGIAIHDDIKTLDATEYAGVDILTGGVPCQPASRAGKRKGAADDRWLWPEALRVVAQARPRVCVFENPPGIEDVGLDGILAALESKGYEIAPVFDIPACAVDSPQLRHRYYIVAYRTSSGPHIHGPGPKEKDRQKQKPEQYRRLQDGIEGCVKVGALPGVGLASGTQNGLPIRSRRPRENSVNHERAPEGGAWGNYVWLPCADGKVRRAPDNPFGLVDGLHRSVLGALGNSQIPQIAQIILRAIKAALT